MQLQSETRLSLSKPPVPKAVRPAPSSPSELDQYHEDLAAYHRAVLEDEAQMSAWWQARNLLTTMEGRASDQMRRHDNDFGDAGKYDLNPEVGVLACQNTSGSVFGRSTQIARPKHFWQRKQYTTAIMEYREVTGRTEPIYERNYKSTWSNQKFPSLLWESASQTTMRGLHQAEADYATDTLVWRTYSRS